jgi:hypothetical protein
MRGKEKSSSCNEKYLMQALVSTCGYKFATWELRERKKRSMMYIYVGEASQVCERDGRNGMTSYVA